MENLTLTEWQNRARNLSIEGRAFLNGRYVEAKSGETRATYNPATGEVIVEVSSCGAEDADYAVQIARATFESGKWSRMEPASRKEVLLKWADLIEEHYEELALLESLDTGKPIACTMDDDGGDVHSSIRTIRWTAESIDKIYDEVSPSTGNTLGIITRVPLGVIAAITPWNYPLATTAWKLAPALGAGNSVIVKPASSTPLTAIRVAELATRAGLPDGVLQVLPGSGASLGKHLAMHMDIDGLTFTGSTPVGKQLLMYSGQSNLKRVFNELGGKGPNIIFPDANLEQAASRAAAAIFFNSGQTCSAGSRLIVHEDIHDEFVQMVVEKSRVWAPGNPMDPATLFGPMIDDGQCRSVDEYVKLGLEEGCALVCGGQKVAVGEAGHYYSPTILANATRGMRVVQEEIFGPVLVVLKFSNADEAIEIANDSIFGLAGAVWTGNIHTANKVANGVRVGTMGVNNYFGGDNQITLPFGGFKQSGNGRDKSIHAFDDYTELKSIWYEFE